MPHFEAARNAAKSSQVSPLSLSVEPRQLCAHRPQHLNHHHCHSALLHPKGSACGIQELEVEFYPLIDQKHSNPPRKIIEEREQSPSSGARGSIPPPTTLFTPPSKRRGAVPEKKSNSFFLSFALFDLVIYPRANGRGLPISQHHY